jgi:arsenate reductase (thioredoxin)
LSEHDAAKKLRVLFLCTGNSCRSQMAEGWARTLIGDAVEPFSAGLAPRGVDPMALKVMREAGVDISNQESTHVSEVLGQFFDYVVTVCGHAHEQCPIFPGKTRVVHVGFNDPPRMAEYAATEEEAMSYYRRVRDEIRSFVEKFPQALMEETVS